MKRIFDLGMSVTPVRGKHRRLTIEVEFGGQSERKPDEGYYATEGQIGGENRWVSAGQCQRKIREICNPKFYEFMDELLYLDKYHLFLCKNIPPKVANRIKKLINSDFPPQYKH